MTNTQDEQACSELRSPLQSRNLRRRVVLWAACLIIGVAVLANCQKQRIEPVGLNPEDMCSYCKMAISEKRYAAELIDSEEQVFKFDDIGCMTNFIKNKSNAQHVAYFVMDFDSRQWVKAEEAYYVRSSEFKTPMNGGVVGFKNESNAREATGKFHGQLLRFQEVVNQ